MGGYLLFSVCVLYFGSCFVNKAAVAAALLSAGRLCAPLSRMQSSRSRSLRSKCRLAERNVVALDSFSSLSAEFGETKSLWRLLV